MTKKHEPHMPQKAHKQPRNHPWGFEKQKKLKDLKKQLPCAVHLNGEYETKDIYAGVPVIIGSNGVEKIIELDLSKEEKENFKKSIEAVKELFNAARKIDPSLK